LNSRPLLKEQEREIVTDEHERQLDWQRERDDKRLFQIIPVRESILVEENRIYCW
jgi:hypothetical protein